MTKQTIIENLSKKAAGTNKEPIAKAISNANENLEKIKDYPAEGTEISDLAHMKRSLEDTIFFGAIIIGRNEKGEVILTDKEITELAKSY